MTFTLTTGKYGEDSVQRANPTVEDIRAAVAAVRNEELAGMILGTIEDETGRSATISAGFFNDVGKKWGLQHDGPRGWWIAKIRDADVEDTFIRWMDRDPGWGESGPWEQLRPADEDMRKVTFSDPAAAARYDNRVEPMYLWLDENDVVIPRDDFPNGDDYYPMFGGRVWCELPDGDQAEIAALFPPAVRRLIDAIAAHPDFDGRAARAFANDNGIEGDFPPEGKWDEFGIAVHKVWDRIRNQPLVAQAAGMLDEFLTTIDLETADPEDIEEKLEASGIDKDVADRLHNLLYGRAREVNAYGAQEQRGRDSARAIFDTMTPADRDRWYFMTGDDRFTFVEERLPVGSRGSHRTHAYHGLRKLIAHDWAGIGYEYRYATAGRKLLGDGMPKKEAAALLQIPQVKLSNVLREYTEDVAISVDDPLRVVVPGPWSQPEGLPTGAQQAEARQARQQEKYAFADTKASKKSVKETAKALREAWGLLEQEQFLLATNDQRERMILDAAPETDPDLVDSINSELRYRIRESEHPLLDILWADTGRLDRYTMARQRFAVAGRALREKGATKKSAAAHLGISISNFSDAPDENLTKLPDDDVLQQLVASFSAS